MRNSARGRDQNVLRAETWIMSFPSDELDRFYEGKQTALGVYNRLLIERHCPPPNLRARVRAFIKVVTQAIVRPDVGAWVDVVIGDDQVATLDGRLDKKRKGKPALSFILPALRKPSE